MDILHKEKEKTALENRYSTDIPNHKTDDLTTKEWKELMRKLALQNWKEIDKKGQNSEEIQARIIKNLERTITENTTTKKHKTHKRRKHI